MSVDTVSSLLNQEKTTSEIPVEHLDYSFIEKCTDIKYLEKILRVLRSGKEGIYPHLIDYCEKHIEKLDPTSRVLRKENPPATSDSFSKDEWSQITEELKTWENEMKVCEVDLKQLSVLNDVENVPPVRGSNCSVQNTASNGVNKNKKKVALPRDYRDWDKFDVEKECSKIDEGVTKKDPPAIINPGLPKIKRKIDTTALADQDKAHLANREKDKGNEAFRANDYEEAVAYYTRSLSVMPTVAAYNNRAQAEIKLQHWHNALKDCQKVLEMEPGNPKALLRRATAHKQLGSLQAAADDIRLVLHTEPQNVIAKKLLEEVDKKMSECAPERPGKAKRLLIQEVEEEEEEHRRTCPAEGSDLRVGGESCAAAAPGERGDMGNAQKKPHGRGDGGGSGPHTTAHNGWKGREKHRAQQDAEGPAADEGKGLANGNGAAHQSHGKESSSGGERVDLDAPAGALPPPLARLKNQGNQLFKNGQFGDALKKYSQAITGFTNSGIDSPEDLCILYSNRAACHLKDGNSSDCIADCTRALELQPFSLKPLLRRAMAYDSLERYPKAYVDYKTVLQIDVSTQAAHDSVNRITRLLIDQDGPEWREKLPEIPLVPLSYQQHRKEETSSAERAAARKAETHFTVHRMEGNDLVKKGQYQEALGKYSECLKLKPDECAIYTNRALCFVKLDRFAEAKRDCHAALRLEPSNKKAFYRRALANKGLKDYLACSSDLQEVLRLDPNVQEAERELEEVTVLLRQSLAAGSPAKARRIVPITEVEGDDETARTTVDGEETPQNHRGEGKSAGEFGQALNEARSHDNTAACADLLRCISPENLPLYVSNHTMLDGHTVSFIMQALDGHLIQKDPDLVYQHLNHLHTADSFSVALMLLDKDERKQMTRLFEHLSAVESQEFSKNDVQNLANKYI